MTTALYCRATMTLVEHNRMRPGYDCRCSGCMAYVAQQRAAEAKPGWQYQ